MDIWTIAFFIIGMVFVCYIIYRYEHILDDNKDSEKSKGN